VFSREFFHQLEDAINQARYEIDEKYHMGQADLRARFHLAAAMERLRNATEPPPIPTEKPSMSITGLKSGAFHGTIEALRQRLIDKQSQGAAKIAAAGEMGAAKIDEAVNSAEAKIDKEVSEVLQDFSEFTNGGPA
jgi:hypothetical protein